MKKYLVLLALVLAVFGSLTSVFAQGPDEEGVGGTIDEGQSQSTDAPADNQAAPDEESNGTVDEGSQNADTTVAPVAAPDEQIGGTVDELLDDVGSLGGLEEADAIQAAELTGTGAQAGPWSSTIYVANPNSASASATIDFYSDAGTLATSTPKTLNAFGSAVVDVAAVGSNFKGSAVVSSDQALAVQVGLSVSPTVDRMEYTGYTAGASKVSAPAIACRAFDQDSDLVVMNVGSADATVSIKYLGTSGTVATKTTSHTIKANSSAYLDVCTELGLTPDSGAHNWLGSASITGAAADKLVAVVFQPYMTAPKAVAYETLAGDGSDKVFFPTALQAAFGVKFTTFYAVQNVGSTDTTITFDISPSKGAPTTRTLAPGAKVSLQPKDAANGANIDGFSGAATVSASSGGQLAAVTNIGALTPASCPTGSGQTGAFLNPSVSGGSNKISIPYVEFKTGTTDWKSFIAVQNIGSATSGTVSVKYYSADGTLVGTDSSMATIDAGAKKNSNPSVSGVAQSNFIGSVVIESTNASDTLIALSNNQQADSCHQASSLGVPVK